VQQLIHFVVPPTLLAISLILRPFAEKSPRLRTAWAFLSLWLAPFLVSFLPAEWNPGIEPLRDIAHALAELAGVQLAAIVVFEIVLRRFPINKFMVAGIIGTASGVILINLLYGLGINATGIFATSVVTVAIIAFALQDMLVSVAFGIVLDLSGGIKVGDYIQCGEWSGWVENLSMRQTTIKDLAGDTIILPNSQLYRSAVRICAPLQRRIIPFVMPHGADSQEVIETVEFALRASPILGIASDPPPVCTIQEMAVSGVTYSIAVFVTGPGDHNAEVSAVLTRIGFALDRAGLPCGDFTSVIEVKTEQAARKGSLTPIELLRRAPILRLLDEEDLHRLASSMRRSSFGPGEIIVRQGEAGDSMFFIGKGKVTILFDSGDGVERQVAMMAGGDFFGEASLLTGEVRSATVQAVSRVDCYQLPKEGLHEFISHRSDLVEDIANVMAQRQRELKDIRVHLDEEQEDEARRQFMSSVQRFFGGSGDRAADSAPKPPERPQTQPGPQAHPAGSPASRPVRRESGNVADASRERAARLLEEGKYSEALQALAEADAIELAEPDAIRPEPIRKDPAKPAKRTMPGTGKVAYPRHVGTVDKAMKIVNRYSKIAAGAGLVPGALINFVAILAVQVTMVWKLARCFGYKEPVERVRGSIMSLLAAGIPAALGHGTAVAVTTTAVVAGSVLYFLFTPVLAYAITQALGRTFVMHFESGGTLLTFDATAFQDYFLREFQEVRGKLPAQKSVAA